MKKLFKCSVCGFIFEGEQAPEVCPKCKQGADKFTALDDAASQLVYQADRTNDIHAEIIALSARIAELCEEGIGLNLDPNCVRAFNDAKNEVWVIKQRCKAELAGHMNKGKW